MYYGLGDTVRNSGDFFLFREIIRLGVQKKFLCFGVRLNLYLIELP